MILAADSWTAATADPAHTAAALTTIVALTGKARPPPRSAG